MEKVAGYLCFKDQGKNAISFNLKKMSDWCLLNNYDCSIYFDKVKSHLDFNRKELDRLKEDIKNKKYSKVIIKDITNISRNTLFNVELLKFFEENNCEVISMDGLNLKLYSTLNQKYSKEEKIR